VAKVSLFRTLSILEWFSRECLTNKVRRKLNSTDVIDALTDLFTLRSVPAFHSFRQWAARN